MKKHSIIIIIIAVLITQSFLFAQDNPFISKKPQEKIGKTTQYPDFINKFLKHISVLQRSLNQKITELSKEIKEKRAEKRINDSSVTKSIIPFAIAVGIIPCTGAIIVLLFSISMGILGIGVISTLCMALGMATTISFVGVSTILAKKGVTRFFINRTKVSSIFQTALSIIGALLIILFGILLFTSTL